MFGPALVHSSAWHCNQQAALTHIIRHIVTHHRSLDATRCTLRAGADASPLSTLNLDSAHDSFGLLQAVPVVAFLSHFERLSRLLIKPTHHIARLLELNVRAGRLH